jgi:hypothetical protein
MALWTKARCIDTTNKASQCTVTPGCTLNINPGVALVGHVVAHCGEVRKDAVAHNARVPHANLQYEGIIGGENWQGGRTEPGESS